MENSVKITVKKLLSRFYLSLKHEWKISDSGDYISKTYNGYNFVIDPKNDYLYLYDSTQFTKIKRFKYRSLPRHLKIYFAYRRIVKSIKNKDLELNNKSYVEKLKNAIDNINDDVNFKKINRKEKLDNLNGKNNN